MEGTLFKKVVTTALFCRPNKRSPDEPRETEINADISSFQWRPFNFFSMGQFLQELYEDGAKYVVQNKNRSELYKLKKYKDNSPTGSRVKNQIPVK
jgi:hypothetical protein